MGSYKEDKSQNFGTIFFIVLFSLIVLIFSSKSASQTSASSGYSFQHEQGFHFEATVFNAVNLPDLYKNSISALNNTSLNLFPLQYRISSYNHRTTQNFINVQKTRLVIEPLLLWRLYYPIYVSAKEDLPVLS